MDKEKFNIEAFPTSESALRMLSYVSQGFYDKSYVGKWLYQVMGLEYDEARKLVEELPYQMFPETATWGLMYHEIKWGLPVMENLPYEKRRQLIYQKRDYRSPITPYRMETYLKNATGFDVFIADCHDIGPYNYNSTHPNIFKVFFIGEGTLDLKAVNKALNRLKQSHTSYVINDRVEIVINNRNIEAVILSNIKIHMHFLFWSILNAGIRNSRLRNKLSIHGPNEKVGEVSVITRKSLWTLNGEVLLDGSRTLNAEYRKEAL